MPTLTVYRVQAPGGRTAYLLDPPPSGVGIPVQVALAEGVRVARSGLQDQRLLYRNGPYGKRVEEALVLHWCRLLPDGAPQRRSERACVRHLAVEGLPARVADISRGGIGLIVTGPLAGGDSLSFVLADILSASRQPARARLVWQEGNRAGLRWEEPSPAREAWLAEHGRPGA